MFSSNTALNCDVSVWLKIRLKQLRLLLCEFTRYEERENLYCIKDCKVKDLMLRKLACYLTKNKIKFLFRRNLVKILKWQFVAGNQITVVLWIRNDINRIWLGKAPELYNSKNLWTKWMQHFCCVIYLFIYYNLVIA